VNVSAGGAEEDAGKAADGEEAMKPKA